MTEWERRAYVSLNPNERGLLEQGIAASCAGEPQLQPEEGAVYGIPPHLVEGRSACRWLPAFGSAQASDCCGEVTAAQQPDPRFLAFAGGDSGRLPMDQIRLSSRLFPDIRQNAPMRLLPTAHACVPAAGTGAPAQQEQPGAKRRKPSQRRWQPCRDHAADTALGLACQDPQLLVQAGQDNRLRAGH